jgi:glycine hydroxymethyltransferase
MTDSERMSLPLSAVDPEIYEAIQHEAERQHSRLELIASENFTSEAVLQATGSVFTNKYAEGYPGKRYYGGCEFTDVVETLARERAKKLFGAEYVNVQPHSGSQANQAAYSAVIQPGDVILGMNLAHGGHLTHGHPLNFSGKTYRVIPYGVTREDERIDYAELGRLAEEHRPKLIIAGGSAYPRIIDFARFRKIADSVGAIFLVDMAHISGLVAAGVHPNPCEYADIVTSTTHKTLRGPRSGMILAKAKYGAAIDRALFPGIQGGPLVHVIAAKAVCFLEAMTPEFRAYSKQVIANAQALAAGLQQQGFRVVSGGTDTHLMLVDVFAKGVRGKEAETALDEAYITTNKNVIPFDVNPPLNPSGIRLGSPAVTTRGFREAEMRQVAALIADALNDVQSTETLLAVRRRVTELAERFPLYAWKLARVSA